MVLRFEWLEVQQFRDVVPGTRVAFGPGLNVIVGLNGSGKTTLLSLLGALTRWDFASLATGPVSLRYRLDTGDGGLTCTFESRRRERPAAMERPPSESWAWSVLFEIDRVVRLGDGSVEQRGTVAVVDESGIAIASDSLSGSSIEIGLAPEDRSGIGLLRAVSRAAGQLWSPPAESASDVHRFVTSSNALNPFAVLGAIGPGRLDEAVDVFRNLVGDGPSRTVPGGPGPFLGVLYGNGKGVALSAEGLPTALTLLLDERVALNAQEARSARVGSSEFPMLGELAGAIGVEEVTVTPDVQRVNERDDEFWAYFTGAEFWFKVNGSGFTHDALSFGQKRLLTFLWYADANPDGPVLVDELANGLHHSWIKLCLDRVADRQTIVVSQNPVIFDFLEFESATDVGRRIVRCVGERDAKGRRAWRWGNVTEAEAERIFASYEAGFLHVSEILRNVGVW